MRATRNDLPLPPTEQPESEMFCIVQEDITAVTKEGKLLLSNLEDPDVGECSQDQHRERPGDWETVNR